MQRHEDPGSKGGQRRATASREGEWVPLGVEGNALSPRGLGLELCRVSGVLARMAVQPRTLVNMLGDEAMVELRAKPQLQ